MSFISALYQAKTNSGSAIASRPTIGPASALSTVAIPFPKAATLSASGATGLGTRISASALASLHPAARAAVTVAATHMASSSPEWLQLNSEKSRLTALSRVLADPSSDAGVILGAFMVLSDATKGTILESFWKDHGYVDQMDYANLAIQSDPTILRKASAPFIHSSGGTLIEQMTKVIDQAIQEETTKIAAATLTELERACANPAAMNASLLDIFNKIDPKIQNELYGHVYHQSPDRDPSVGNWGEVKLRSNVGCLVTLRDPSQAGVHLLSQITTSLKTRVVEQKQAEQKAHFLALYHSDKLGHFELKHLFEALPASIQAHADMPKPPFYGKGVRAELYKVYGAHNSGAETTFKVYAPNAKEIRLAIRPDGNFARETFIPMHKGIGGVWEVTTPAPIGTKYQYLIKGQDDVVRRKSDPYATDSTQEIFDSEATYGNTKQQLSIVADTSFAWTDAEAIATRSTDPDAPANIYEVHVSSWKKRADGSTMNWRELAVDLAAYLKDMNYTHVELVGAMDHPDERSWGYQTGGFFAPNHRMGSAQDLKFFVNYMHSQGIKVIVDWVPGHFAIAEFSLRNFDGSGGLYEHVDSRRSYQAEWDVYMLDYEKRSVRDFLTSSANYWASEFHVDGLRVDAVTGMLHTDIGRKKTATGDAEYLPHHKGKRGWAGQVHSDAKTFFKDLNTLLHTRHRGIVTHAEESAGFPGLTAPVSEKRSDEMTSFSKRGLGFDAKWNMARMTLSLTKYMRENPFARRLFNITEGMKVDGLERVVDSTSHDESANGKGSLRGAMFGTHAEQFAQVRLWLSRAICAPGMKLTMMGNEIAQHEEWSGRHKRELDGSEPGIAAFEWGAIEGATAYEPCKQVRQMVKDLNALYLGHPALTSSNKASDFTWIDGSDEANQIISYHRTSKDGTSRLACIHNFGTSRFEEYETPLPSSSYDPLINRIRGIREIFNSDDARYGGSGMTNSGASVSIENNAAGVPIKIKLRLPPQSTIILEETLA